MSTGIQPRPPRAVKRLPGSTSGQGDRDVARLGGRGWDKTQGLNVTGREGTPHSFPCLAHPLERVLIAQFTAGCAAQPLAAAWSRPSPDMSRRKHLEVLQRSIEAPEAGQQIVRAVGSRGSNLIEASAVPSMHRHVTAANRASRGASLPEQPASVRLGIGLRAYCTANATAEGPAPPPASRRRRRRRSPPQRIAQCCSHSVALYEAIC